MFPKEPSFKQMTSAWSPIRRIALPLIAQKGDQACSVGTATLVHPHIAITASHVIDDFRRTYHPHPPHHAEVSFSLVAAMVNYSPDGSGLLYAVKKIFQQPESSDLAILLIEHFSDVPADFEPLAPKIDLMPPAVGERISAFGYPKTDVDASQGALNVTLNPYTSVGEVTEIFPVKRDSGLLRFPCYSTNARFEHGMSGGPIFNDDGNVCGIICDGLPHEEGVDDHSHGSTLWPLSGFLVDLPISPDPPEPPYFARTLFERNIVTGLGWEECIVSKQGDEIQMRVPQGWREGRPTKARAVP